MAMTAVSSTVELEELIRERSVERVKKLQKAKKRQEGNLRRIVEMKSAIGVNPLALFPKEIWMEIMDKVTPKGRWNMYQIHPTFQSLLESSKIRDVLFPQALAVVMDYIKNNEVHPTYHWYSHEMTYEEDISKSDLLPFIKLRQVSKSLRDSIDHWFEKSLLEDLHHDSISISCAENRKQVEVTNMTFQVCRGGREYPRPKSRRKELIRKIHQSDSGRADEDTAIHKKDKKIFLKAIQFVLAPCSYDLDPDFDVEDIEEARRNAYEQLYNEFKTEMISFLQLYGDQIWCFKLNADPSQGYDYLRRDMVELYTFLQQCCELMPNLKWMDLSLYIYYDLDEKRDFEPIPGERTVFPRNMFDLHRFPKLQKLERIDFDQGKKLGTASIVHNAILEANPQVKILKLLGLSSAFEGISFPVLKTLNLESCAFGNRHSIGFDFNIWKQPLMDFSWPLKTLDLRVGRFMEMDWVTLFEPLQQLLTLEKVCLYLDGMKLKIGHGAVFLNLPNLKHFEIEFSPEIDYSSADICQFFSLNFLFHSEKLECLLWKTFKTNKNQEGTRIKFEDKKLIQFMKTHERREKMLNFRGGIGDLTHSNLWDAFPRLKRMLVSFNVRSKHLTVCGRTTMINEYRRFGQIIEKKSKIEFK